MKRPEMVLVGCAWIALAVGRAFGADVETEKEKLKGTWKSVSYEYLGADGAVVNLKGAATLIFDGNFVELKLQQGGTRHYLDLDVDESPKKIVLTEKRRDFKDPGLANKGIYSRDGDELTICFGGSKQPTRFQLRPRPEYDDALIKLKRQPK